MSTDNVVNVYDNGKGAAVIDLNGMRLQKVMSYQYSHDRAVGKTVTITLHVEDFQLHFKEAPPCK